ncbi:hypothetical protein B0H10DRAFT_2137579 [Mycena sp. CBHHK59/15]|nr:hypothetical protein B0H10DRAFT_2137579 [Mycena sp. CBHHK59/15]
MAGRATTRPTEPLNGAPPRRLHTAVPFDVPQSHYRHRPGSAHAHAEAQVHVQRPAPSSFLPYELPPVYSHPQYQHPPPDRNDVFVHKLTQSVGQVFAAHQAHSEARMNRVETSIQNLSSELSSVRQEARDSTRQISQMLERSHKIHTNRLEKMARFLGAVPETKDDKTLVDRVNMLSFAVEEMLERMRDPEANVSESDGPIHHDMATSPIKPVYVDAVVPPKTPSPKRHLSSVAVGHSPPVSPDADVFSVNFPSFTTAGTHSQQSHPYFSKKCSGR